MIRYTYFRFCDSQYRKGNSRKAKSSVYSDLGFSVWFHSIGLTNKQSNHPSFVFQLAIIRKHKWELYPSVLLWLLCSSYKTLTKGNPFVPSIFPLSRNEPVMNKRKSPPHQNSLPLFAFRICKSQIGFTNGTVVADR